MEPGTNGDGDALSRERPDFDYRREAGDRLLRGVVAVFAGLVLLMLAGAREVCGFTARGATRNCVAAAPGPTVLLLGTLGTVTVGYGVWLCWSVLRT